MKPYFVLGSFVFGNVWLVLSVILFLGRHVERTEPDMVSFFGAGDWLYPGTYSLLEMLCVAASVACFILAYRATRRVA